LRGNDRRDLDLAAAIARCAPWRWLAELEARRGERWSARL